MRTVFSHQVYLWLKKEKRASHGAPIKHETSSNFVLVNLLDVENKVCVVFVMISEQTA